MLGQAFKTSGMTNKMKLVSCEFQQAFLWVVYAIACQYNIKNAI
jgi:hypothetical protein